MDGDVVARGSYESRKTDVVPGEDLAVGCPRDESLGHVPAFVNEIWRFLAGTSAICWWWWKMVNERGRKKKLTTLWAREGDDDRDSEEQGEDDGGDAKGSVMGARCDTIILV